MASAERTDIFINPTKGQPEDTFFDPVYASSICVYDDKYLNAEHSKYKTSLKNFKKVKKRNGKKKAHGYYKKHMEAIQKAVDIENVMLARLIGMTCEKMKKKGYFGK